MDSEAGVLRCPSCGAPCSPEARACSHCEVELASVRCAHCFALHFTGSLFCARCGRELAPEPVLDAVDAPCPRCAHALSAASGGSPALADGRYECTACGGIFVDRAALERILARESRPNPAGPPPHTAGHGIAEHAAEPVRYLRCPVCQAVMNRVHFARHSGVVVNVCKEHGTWFDAGELTAAVEFVSRGGSSP
jgi:Zn-finger nucleic acid-binding protein